jgi:flavin-binding protein dodecin
VNEYTVEFPDLASAVSDAIRKGQYTIYQLDNAEPYDDRGEIVCAVRLEVTIKGTFKVNADGDETTSVVVDIDR